MIPEDMEILGINMKYREEKDKTKGFKQEYVSGINAVLEKRAEEAGHSRNRYFKDIFKEPEKYRDDFKAMLGWPLTGKEARSEPKVSMELLSGEDGYNVFRMRIEILDDLVMTGVFFKADGEEKKPLVILQHGGLGTPELISGIYGDTANYNDMLHRTIRYGVHAFAPQLLLWSGEYDVPYNRIEIDAKLKRVGSSITAIEVYGIMRVLDYFENQSYVSTFGMFGLSYGGFYTLFTAAVDTRIKSAIASGFFSTRDKYGWADWVWFDYASKFDDAEIACLIWPRKLCLQIGDKDDIFDYTYSVQSFEKIKEYCLKADTNWVDFILFEGGHETYRDDAPIEKMIAELKKQD